MNSNSLVLVELVKVNRVYFQSCQEMALLKYT